MSGDEEPSSVERQGEITPWQRRILLAVLPGGVVLLVLWIVWIAWVALAGGLENAGIPAASAGLGLVTSLLLIVSGYRYRRILGRHPR